MRQCLVLLSEIVLVVGCSRKQKVKENDTSKKVKVVYEVTGTIEKASIAALIDRKIEYFRDVPLHWKYEYEETPGFAVILSAKVDSTDSGEIIATIFSNGEKVHEKSLTGKGVIAEAKGKI